MYQRNECELNCMSMVKSFSFPNGEIRGDMFYIKDNSNILTIIDCFLKDDEIIKEIKRELQDKKCNFISTHPDIDHIRGIEYIFEDCYKECGYRNFFAVMNDYPQNNNESSLIWYRWLLSNMDRRFAIRKERKICYHDSIIEFHWPNLNNEKFKETLKLVSDGNNVNNICPIFTYKINNGATYMWMGDLETDMQQAYYDECIQFNNEIPQVDILFHPHHGRKSGTVPPDLLEALNPKLIVIGNAPSDYINYKNSDKTITQNTAGDIVFYNDGKEVHIYTKNDINNKPICLEAKKEFSNIKQSGNELYYIGTLYV